MVVQPTYEGSIYHQLTNDGLNGLVKALTVYEI